MRGRKWNGALVCVVGGLVLTGGCATAPAELAGPTDVRITELAPEVLDALADRVAERLRADRQPPARVIGLGGSGGGFGLRGGRRSAPRITQPVRPKRPSARLAPVPTVDPVPAEPLETRTLKRVATAIDTSLEWLASQQAEDGSWRAERMGGEANYTPGITGLITLAFLEAGHTHVSGKHKEQVKNGLRYLKSIQDAEGCFGPRVSQHFMYNHAGGALAMVEAYKLTESKLFERPAQMAVNFVQQAQNPYMGWRYGVRDGDNDTSVTGWMTHVLARARGTLEVDANAFKGALSWIEKMTEPEFGRTGYQQRGGQPARTTEMMERFPAQHSEALTAIGVLVRLDAGGKPNADANVQKGAKLVSAKLPIWAPKSGTIDFYYWHWGTLAMARVGGDGWLRWQRALVRALLEGQDTAVSARGSWPADGPWGTIGGRYYTTALSTLALQEVLTRSKAQ